MRLFTDLLAEYGVEHRTSGHHHTRPGWCNVDCPACSPGWGHFRLGFHLSRAFSHCWRRVRKKRYNRYNR